ncbi:MAG: hypothetical protein MUE32_02200 [Bacteroidales bacterium]|jgi:hypothetical protein|nr:hypothetical protein [Bacteroidales bacterium]
MKKILFFPALFILTLAAAGQGTDFTGTWALNSGKSKLNDQFTFAPKQIIVTQAANEINVEKHSSFQDQEFVTKDKYSLDGKECINPGFQDSQKKSTANWSEDKKTLKVVSKLPMGDGGEILITEVYKLDGGNMVIESASSSSFGEMAETMVYDKK